MADSPSSPRDRSEESFERLWPVYGFFVAVATVLVLLLILFAPTSRFSPALERVGTGSSATVTITHVTILFTGPSNCWTSSTLSGGKVSGGHTFTLTATLSYAAKPGKPHFCTVTSVTVPTTGFSIVKTNLPLAVSSGGSRTLSITVMVPTRSYDGALTINAVDTSSARTHFSAS